MFERRTKDHRSNPQSPFSCLFLLLDWMMFPFVFIRVHSWFNCIVTAKADISALPPPQPPISRAGNRNRARESDRPIKEKERDHEHEIVAKIKRSGEIVRNSECNDGTDTERRHSCRRLRTKGDRNLSANPD